MTSPTKPELHNVSHFRQRLVGRLTSPFSTKIGYIGNKVLGGDLVRQVEDGLANDTVGLTSRPRCLFVQRRPKRGNDRGGSFKLLR